MSSLPNPEETIVDAALALPPEQRGAYLEQACGRDKTLRELVEGMLKSHEQAGMLLERGDDREGGSTIALDAWASAKPGDRIGRYRLLQEIGHGGCGVVYMAEQQEPVKRRVALKVIKLGMDTKQVIARFEAERQALALMDHQNIAKVLDAGATETGRPYFVMELVKGISITRYCDENNMNTVARLGLFVQVCQAIQHAHQKGIIHRDIKPSNILVADHAGVPTPKIIDFGIAKATTDQRLTDKTLFTAFEQFIGTPAYMSPEQAKLSGLDVDTRSDIYSLGVLLYELLTGKTPFDASRLLEGGLDEIRRIIREVEPPKPSTRLSTLDAAEQAALASRRHSEPTKLFRLIRGDLDWIVMKALERDRTRRYETANGLVMDLQRHLNSEPVLARPPTAAYRITKLLRKHKTAAIMAATLTVLLISGLAWTLILLARETKARDQAAREAHKTKQVKTFLTDMFQGLTSEDEYKDLDKTILAKLADRAALNIGNLQGEPEVEAELRNTLGRAYIAAADWPEAKSMLERALEIRVALFGSNDLSAAESMADLAQVVFTGRYRGALSQKTLPAERAKDLDHAEGLTRAALDTRRRLLGPESIEVAECLRFLGRLRKTKGDLAGARLAYREAVAIYDKSHSSATRWYVWSLFSALASVEAQSGNLGEAENCLRRGMEYSQKPGEEIWLIANAAALAKVLETQTNLAGAESALKKALATLEQQGAFNKPETAIGCANLWTRLGNVCLAQTNFNAAEQACGHALDLEKQPFISGSAMRAIPHLLGKISFVHQSKGDFRKAETALLKASEYLDAPHAPPDSKADISTRLADLYAAWGKPEEEAKWRNKVAELKMREQSKEEDTKAGANQP